ncbi:MAG: hypothetical protein GX128_02205 [Bacteroidales bacterium]|nr:hypothetical protein [Bacteroidales bacterium]
MLQKGKKIGSKIVDESKNIVQNPVEKLDTLLDKDAKQVPTVDPEDPNKQTLEQLENPEK